MIEEDSESSKYKELVDNCKILFCKKRFIVQDGVSRAFECNESWFDPLSELCYGLEALNIFFYKNFRVRVYPNQIKSKFGTLCFYYQISIDKPLIIRVIVSSLDKINDLLDKVDYHEMERKTEPMHYEYEVSQLLDSEWLRERQQMRCSNVRSYDKDDKHWNETWYEKMKKVEMIITKHKFLAWLKREIKQFRNYLEYDCEFSKTSNEQIVASRALDSATGELIKKAEKDCLDRCEACGNHLYDNACETTGWISYLCKRCAEKQGHNYFFKGALWNKKKIIKTKEQLEEEKKPDPNDFYDLEESEWSKREKKLKEQIEEAIQKENLSLEGYNLKR